MFKQICKLLIKYCIFVIRFKVLEIVFNSYSDSLINNTLLYRRKPKTPFWNNLYLAIETGKLNHSLHILRIPAFVKGVFIKMGMMISERVWL